MKFNKQTISFLIFLCVMQGFAQQILTKKVALEITLENNYGIKIANNNLKAAENNTSVLNTGYLPTVTLNSGAEYRRNNQSLTLTDRDTGGDVEISGDGIVTKAYNASLGLNYTIFDGLGRKYNYQQLQETYNLTELQARETIENTYLQLFTVYFQIARLSENTDNLKEALGISQERLKRAGYQYDYGQSTKLELLNAEVDVNNDSISFINSRQQYINAKRSLNIILGVDKSNNYDVETQVEFDNLFNFDELLAKSIKNNVGIKQNETNMAITEFNLKVNKSNYLPILGFNASYGFNRTENENLINPFGARLITSDGLNAGINLTWNIFDGGVTKTRIANAKIELDNQAILKEQQEETLKNNLRNTFDNYRNQLFILKAQEKNVVTAENNFQRTEERFKLGQITSIEFRTAQINLINTKTALNNAKFDAKIIELNLLQISGEILDISI